MSTPSVLSRLFIDSVEDSIEFVDVGTAASGTTTLAVPFPLSAITAGDLLILAIVNKYPDNGPETPDGWTALVGNQENGGAGSAGADTGEVFTTVFVRIADGTEGGDDVDVSIPSGNAAIGQISQYRKDSAAEWDIVLTSGVDSAGGTIFAATGQSVDFKKGDILVAVLGINGDNRTWSAESLSAPGITFDTVTERADGSTSNGDDCAMVLVDATVTQAAAGSHPPTVGATGSGAGGTGGSGAAIFLRLRQDRTRDFSDAPIETTLGRQYEPRVLSWGHIERSIPYPAGIVHIGDGNLELADHDGHVRAWFEEQTPRRRFIETKLIPEGESETGTTPIATQEVKTASYSPGKAYVSTLATTWSWLDTPIVPLGTRDNFPNLPAGVEVEFINLIFGLVKGFSADPNPQGQVRCPLVDTSLNRYAVARHEVHDVIAVYRRKSTANGFFLLVDPSEYTWTTDDMEIDGVTYTITYLDFDEQQLDGAEIRADISGVNYFGGLGEDPYLIPVATGELRNPIYAVGNLLYYFSLLVPRQSPYSYQDLYNTWQECESRGYLFDGVIDKSEKPRDILEQINKSFGFDFFENRFGRIAVCLDQLDEEGDSSPPTEVPTITSNMVLGDLRPDLPTNTANRIRYRYAYNYATQKWGFEGTLDNTADQAEMLLPGETTGNIEEKVVELPFVRDDDVALAIIRERIGYYTLRSWPVAFTIPLLTAISLGLDLVGRFKLTHFGGIDVLDEGGDQPGWVDKKFKIVGLVANLNNLTMEVRAVKRYSPSDLTLQASWDPEEGHPEPATPPLNPPVFPGRWWATVVGEGLEEIGTDVTLNHKRIPVDMTLTSVLSTAKEPPSGGDYVADVLVSSNQGATWDSIFNSGDSNKAYIADGDYEGDQSSFAITSLSAGDWLSVDVVDVSGATGIEILIQAVPD